MKKVALSGTLFSTRTSSTPAVVVDEFDDNDVGGVFDKDNEDEVEDSDDDDNGAGVCTERNFPLTQSIN